MDALTNIQLSSVKRNSKKKVMEKNNNEIRYLTINAKFNFKYLKWGFGVLGFWGFGVQAQGLI